MGFLRLFGIVFLCIAATINTAYCSEESEAKSNQENGLEKRDWNQAAGLWGKRSMMMDVDEENDMNAEEKRAWNSANSLWGKRAGKQATEINWSDKRAPWQAATGLWGKRSMDQSSLYQKAILSRIRQLLSEVKKEKN